MIYSSVESAELMNALTTNLAHGKDVVNQLKLGSQKVVDAVDGKVLGGAAYTAGKGLFSGLILPTLNRVATAYDDLEQELKKYQIADRDISIEGYLDEEQLNRLIKIKEAMIASVKLMIANAITASVSNPAATVLDTLEGILKKLNRMVAEIQRDIQELREKLKKLLYFAYQTKGLFSHSLNNIMLAMQAVLVLKNTFIKDNGSYILPIGTDPSWFILLKNQLVGPLTAAQAVLCMPKNMTTENTKDWLIENFKTFGSSILVYLQDMIASGEKILGLTLEKGRLFLNGTRVTLDSLGRLRLGDIVASLTPKVNFDWSNLMAIGKGKFKEAINPVANFKGWRSPKTTALGKLGKTFGIAGTAIQVINNYQDNIDLSDGLSFKEVVDFTTDTVVDIGSSAAMGAAGAALGSLIAPPLGTVVGGAAGLAFDMCINIKFGNPPKSVVDSVKDGVKNATNFVGESVGDFVETAKEGMKSVKDTVGKALNATGNFFSSAISWIGG